MFCESCFTRHMKPKFPIVVGMIFCRIIFYVVIMGKQRVLKWLKSFPKVLAEPGTIISLLGILTPFVILIFTVNSNHKESIAVAKHSQYLSWLNEFTAASAEFVDVEINEANRLLSNISNFEIRQYDYGDDYEYYYDEIVKFKIKANSVYTKFYFYLPVSNFIDEKERMYNEKIIHYHERLQAVLEDVENVFFLYKNSDNDVVWENGIWNVIFDADSVSGLTRLSNYMDKEDIVDVWNEDNWLVLDVVPKLVAQIDGYETAETLRAFVEYEKKKIQEPLIEIR